MTSQQFRAIRLSLGLTQQELAVRLGMAGKQAIHRIESGERQPTKIQAAFLRYILQTESPK